MGAFRDVGCDGLYYEPDVQCQRASFSMGCFWAPEALFGATPGVLRTRVGYAGLGTVANPTYKNIFDYTETVEMEFNPRATDFDTLLNLFWNNHDPTAYCERQYKSIIFYHTPEQKELAEKSLKKETNNRSRPIKTQIYNTKEFYEAEDYHQKYFLQKYPWLMNMMDIKVGMPLVRSKMASALNGYCAGYGSPEQFEKDWRRLGICCEVVEYVRKIIEKNYRKPLGCEPL